MSNVAIRVDGLGKCYRLGARVRRHDTLRDKLTHGFGAMFRRKQQNDRAFWAVQDLSFEVQQGEAVGIIGRNAAGKSTLLKILSRVTEPTCGQAQIYGRVGSLLEVGTGFHAELSGRENVYLNGAILGMRKAEIERKFDAIVDFAGVEKFIDTPVKRYSSGMYVRLAFAVAAHLETEVLLVDEVLAVGDAAFQKRCLGKMGEVARQGRTILFISHNMAAVEHLCHRGFVLQSGRLQFVGSQTEAVARYLTSLTDVSTSIHERQDRSGTGEVRIIGFEMRDTHGKVLDCAKSGQKVDFYLYFENPTATKHTMVNASITFKTQWDVPVFLQHNRLTKHDFGELPSSGAFVCRVPQLPLPAATYRLGFSLLTDGGRGEYLDRIDDAVELEVVEGDFFGSGEVPPISHGVCLVKADWRLEPHQRYQGGSSAVARSTQ